jgi:CRISP-associated protein Cas1
MHDLQTLPKLSDSLSYLYAEHCIVEKKQQAIELFDQGGATLVPAAALTVLLLGPGTRITHAAVKTLADNGCAIVWVGEDGTRCYAHGGGETRKGYHLLHQARLATNEALRLEVCKRMYRMRFNEELDPELTIEQLRGMEGARVRSAYARFSIAHGVAWSGRSYDRATWGNSDPINRAISAANALLNGLCHAAIVSGGYSTGLGFIHTGLQLSFVYDIADLYKVELTLPTAFRIVEASRDRVEPRVREACRQAFKEAKLLKRILPDIEHLLAIPKEVLAAGEGADEDPGRPEPLWTPPSEYQPEAEGVVSEAAILESPVLTRPPMPAFVPEEEEVSPVKTESLHLRRQRAADGLRSGWEIAEEEAGVWRIITRPGTPGYALRREAEAWVCACPDFAKNGLGACKHTLALEMRESAIEGQELTN